MSFGDSPSRISIVAMQVWIAESYNTPLLTVLHQIRKRFVVDAAFELFLILAGRQIVSSNAMHKLEVDVEYAAIMLLFTSSHCRSPRRSEVLSSSPTEMSR